MGRIKIQYMGFAVLACVLAILAGFYHVLVEHHLTVFVIIYTIGQFFFNFGPNTTTFVLPSEVFPTKFRTTAHGISAASGKAGAILAAQLFPILKDIGGHDAGVPYLLAAFSIIMILGACVTSWVPETKGKSLEELQFEYGGGREEELRNEMRRTGSYRLTTKN